MNKSHVIIAGISGMLAVALGAFGAHILKDALSASMLETYKTGVLYHLVHSAVLLALSLSQKNFGKAFTFIFAGIILFSFSLYFYSITGFVWLAMITPVGGVCFLLGWGMIVYFGIKSKNNT